jgi:exopolysaccharide biosynthesis predicted pyruvyltransferase EpsI
MPNIAFQLGPCEPLHSSHFGPNAVDIVFLLRKDLESVETISRNSTVVHSILRSLVGEERATNTKFRIVDENTRLVLAMGRVLICDGLDASILAYLSGILFICIDQITGKISKTLGVALDSAEGCANGHESNLPEP